MSNQSRIKAAKLLFGATALLAAVAIGCSGRRAVPPDEALVKIRKEGGEYANLGKDSTPDQWRAAALKEFKPAEANYFAEMDYAAGADGKVGPLKLSPEEIKGRNAWVLWAGGNEAFWDWLSRHSYGSLDLLKLIDSEERGKRFARWGGMTNPDTVPPSPEETEAAYGVRFERLKDPAKKYTIDKNKVNYADPYKESYPAGAYVPDPKVYGYATGVVGLYLFWNPEFLNSPSARANWDANRYYNDPKYASRADTIRPFRVGMSCGFCHIGHHPLNPPADKEYPEWKNMSTNIGNQYMRFRSVFGGTLKSDNFLYHVLDAQHPGTIDTSLVAADNLNNPNTVNSFFGLRGRLERALHNPRETVSGDTLDYLKKYVPAGALEDHSNPRFVPRVLLDGSDSVGVHIALSRVYLNIGTHHQQWVRLHNVLLGFRKQEPFKLRDVAENSLYWHATLLRVDSLAAYFLAATDPMRLKDAPMGKELGQLRGDGTSWYTDPTPPKKDETKKDEPKQPATPTDYTKGREVFARGCIACHSSIQPGDLPSLEAMIKPDGLPADRTGLRLRMEDLERLTRGDGTLPEKYALWAMEAVKHKEFWEHKVTEKGADGKPVLDAAGKPKEHIVHNYLSTDVRIPVTITHTNSARAMATNAIHGDMWEDFASQTYKELDSVGRIKYFDPFSGAEKSFQAPSNGPGYYRVPTLISIWATAPFLHNNALGTFNGEPAVQKRLEAFNDAIGRLLWPERRLVPTTYVEWKVSKEYYKEPMSVTVDPEQIKKDNGWIWRTPEKTWIRFYGHELPTFVAGLTGWPDWLVSLLPWLPSLLFVVLGVLLLLSGSVTRMRQKVENKVSFAGWVFGPIRWFLLVGSFLLFVVSGYLVWFKFSYIVDLLSVAVEGTPRWWLYLQVSSAPIFFLSISVWVGLSMIRGQMLRHRTAYFFAVVCMIWAIVLALGFGRFLSGRA
jgi:hypothetical protein